jgi:hypothetical protein
MGGKHKIGVGIVTPCASVMSGATAVAQGDNKSSLQVALKAAVIIMGDAGSGSPRPTSLVAPPGRSRRKASKRAVAG